MKYCKKCIMPDTRPDQIFNEHGVCNACLSFKNLKNKKVDWTKRAQELDKIINSTKSKNTNWDCVIPSSGDSKR